MSLLSLLMGDGGFDPTDLAQSYAEDAYSPSYWDALPSWLDTAQNTYDVFQGNYPQTLFSPQGNNYAEQYGLTFDEPGGSVGSMVGGSTSPWDQLSSGLQSAGEFASSKGGQLAIGGLGGLAGYLDARKKNALLKQMMAQAAAEKAAHDAKVSAYDAPSRVTNTKTALPSWGAGQQAFSGNSLREMAPRATNTMYAAGGGYVSGESLGQADKIPAMLSDGEYVVDADVVSALGDGNNAAGASALAQMSENIRKHKRSAPAHQIPPKAKNPAAYLKGGK